MMDIRSKPALPLIVAIGLPIGMILVVIGLALLPGWLATPPQTDFLYADQRYYPNRERLYVEDNKLQIEESIDEDEPMRSRMEFFRYDVSERESVALTQEEASALTLSDDQTSPDGFRLERSRGGQEFFFMGVDSGSRWVLTNQNYSYQVDLPYNLQFIGWVING